MSELMCPDCECTDINRVMWSMNYVCANCKCGENDDHEIDNSDSFRLASLRHKHKAVKSEVADLKRKLDLAIEALEFYAEIKNWALPISVVRGNGGNWRNTLAVEDCAFFNAGGGRARQALAKIKESEK